MKVSPTDNNKEIKCNKFVCKIMNVKSDFRLIILFKFYQINETLKLIIDVWYFNNHIQKSHFKMKGNCVLFNFNLYFIILN